MNDDQVTVKITTTSDTRGVTQTKDALHGVGDSANSLDSKMGVLSGAMKGFAAAAAAAAAAAVGTGIAIGFKFNSSVEQAEAQIMAFTKDARLTAETLAWVKEEAAQTQFSFTDMAQATAGLIPVSKSSRVALQDLVKQAEILGALNPAEGLTGAAFALREALSGDWTSIVERFNLPRSRINELKEQGVPAMEIISQSLREMGIDYGLVAAQGATTAARFDQLKDKLTMLAGAATQPLFDKISASLDEINGGGLDKFINDLQSLWNIVSPYLLPSFKALGETLQDRLLPAFEKISPILELQAKIVGGALVGAIWLFTNALNAAISTLSWFWQVQGNVASGTIAAFQSVASGISGAFRSAFNLIADAWNKTVGAIDFKIPNWVPGLGGKSFDVPNIPKFSNGVENFEGGLAYVHQGEVLANLPRGTDVIPRRQVEGMTNGSSINVNITGPVYANSEQQVDDFSKRLANQLLAARAGSF